MILLRSSLDEGCMVAVWLTLSPFLPGRPAFWHLYPASCHNPSHDASWPISQRYPVLHACTTAWNENVWYFAPLQELIFILKVCQKAVHLKFQTFSGATPSDQTPTAGGGNPLPHQPPAWLFRLCAVASAPGAGTQTLTLWVVHF